MNEVADDASLESLLEYLRDTRNLDFTGYKRPSLTRRIRRRVDAAGVEGFDEYRDVLEADPDEQARLVDTILINVTAFFRDELAWDFLAAEVVPDIVARSGGGPIRVWSAGCASGEEAYSLAMVFADHLGIDGFKDRVKIFATDTDDAALAEARRGVYARRQVEAVSAERRALYFEDVPDGLAFRQDCRRQVIFGRNDVTADAPISRLDLLVCRNVLMYFVADTQRHVLNRFSYALKPTGYLFLGKAETITSHADLFDPVSRALRVFRRSAANAPRLALSTLADRVDTPEVLHGLALAATPVAQLVIDVDGLISGANIKARAMFGIGARDIGRSFWDFHVARHPVDLRPHIEQAYAEGRPVVLHEVTRTLTDGQRQFLEVSIAPLSTPAGIYLGASVTFTDVSELGRMRLDLEQSTRDLAVANAGLRSINEQLATSNEELQSTNQELETTNEELQSANEELETTNEELQSANTELETMNEELLAQTNQIEAAERFLTAILDGLPIAVVVTTRDLDVLVWNATAEDLFGLRSGDVVGRSFLALDIGVPVGALGPLLHAAAAGASTSAESAAQSVTLGAIDRRGRGFSCRCTVRPIGLPTAADTDDTDGAASESTVLLLMEAETMDGRSRHHCDERLRPPRDRQSADAPEQADRPLRVR